MKLKTLFPLYLAVVFAVPGAMIYCHETILKTGEPYLFKTRPVDPYDLFRGRYVSLAFEQDTFDYKGSEYFDAKDKVYAVLGQDAQGFASIASLTRVKPEDGAYLKVRVAWHETSRWVYDEKTKVGENVAVNTVHLLLPFNRFYMNEKKAPKAEDYYRRVHTEAQEKKTEVNLSAQVRVLKGHGILEKVLAEGKPIQESL